MLESEAGGGLLNTGRDAFEFMRRFRQIIDPLVEHALDDMWRACQQADVIFYSLLAFTSHYIAQELRIPAIPALLQPLSRTRHFPTILSPFKSSFGGAFNLLSHILVEQIFWQSLRPSLNKWCQKQALPKAPFWGHFAQSYQQKAPFLYGYSPTVVPRPSDWGEGIHVTGYWFLDTPLEWVPPPELVDFLASGAPPVCVGFGSMKSIALEERTELVLAVLARSRQRGILLTGWGGFSNSDLPDEVFKIEAVPHDWLFPHLSAVIHHGGAGTTAAAMRAGKPAIIVPFFFDQAF
jgi:UDP:flavonoid glycosyltransferase YjiC (YdhE family)